MRPTLGQNLCVRRNGRGKAAASREYGCVQVSLDTAAAVCGAFLRTLSLGSADPVDDGLNLLPDANHDVAEAIELLLRFALRRLDHQRPGHWKRHRRGVKSEVHQALGDVGFVDAARLLQGRRSKISSWATRPFCRV